MWLTNYLSVNSRKKQNAACGDITQANANTVAVQASVEHRGLPVVAPYGIVYMPPVGENSVVLPTEEGEICLGVIAKEKNLNPGELMLFSKGGASVILKNDGSVIINGQVFGGEG